MFGEFGFSIILQHSWVAYDIVILGVYIYLFIFTKKSIIIHLLKDDPSPTFSVFFPDGEADLA
jgi:hypothetical protein